MTALEVIKDETMHKKELARFINSSLDGRITDQELVYIQYVERKGELQAQVADLCKPRLQTFANPGCRPLQTQVLPCQSPTRACWLSERWSFESVAGCSSIHRGFEEKN